MFERLVPVLVNWNLKDDTLECVQSLLTAGVAVERIVVVDNGSTDGSVPALRAAFGPSLPVVAAADNRGYAAGVNLGARHALALGADWLFLMNNDTVVAPDFVAALAAEACAARSFAILAPLIFYRHAPDLIWYCGDRLVAGTLFTRSLYRDRPVGPGLPALLPVDFVTGCGMLVRHDVFTTCGFFDESLFMYGEEVDYCWRARAAGYQLAVVTGARMWHKVSASANRDRPLARYLRVQNQNRFYWRYARGVRRPLMFVLSGLRVLAISLRAALAGEGSLAWAGLAGWWNGWRGRLRTTWG